MNIIDISIWRLIAGYGLLAIPLGIIIWMRLPMLGDTLSAVARMTLQLLFVGFYLQVIFDLDNFWLTGAWVMVMILVADLSIARGCRLRISRLAGGLFWALAAGTFIPLAFFVGLVLGGTEAWSAQYIIPIGGMILGNCLRADIIGIRTFYESLQENEKAYLLSLAQGANLKEALLPFTREALQAALAPTIATMATIGLVSLPGMMTGVILGGGDPMTAIKYQIAIMIAIYVGTAITVLLAIRLTAQRNFTPHGTLDPGLFPADRP
ncbi:ABC transporter permease [Geoalkalibacter halelectricus]|uniref:ABC transporter permease n=1 Tax=Geoalkalibacter halelectricus TaxID=2847045 RepID=A0ABY5ZKB9_9BACT|nr:ABC transporter permease [Geoalkalibacter halelectricus]MDO3380176.1 ABC transporter permease [Geoalkalibacter halelectricus]UWZ78250.1 ABC transporter permease [Geoalkalibacter halelectricus]